MFITFVGVSTCSVNFLLSIYRTQLFKQIIEVIQGLQDYIQSVLLLLISLAQLSYFFSMTLKLILQSMTIWKIRYHNIFQVFIEVKTCLVLHV